jgi:hypothetical protein
MKIGEITIKISRCTTGIYLRWWWCGWHYFNFTDGYEIAKTTESKDTQVTRLFSVISKVEHPTRLETKYAYHITLEGITDENILGFTGILLAERVEQYEGGLWREVDITRGDHLIKDEDTGGYILSFEVSRDELPITSSVYHKSLKLYLGDTLCDLDDDELIPINKQTNDIAEMQDRQSDFTAQFKIRKTREMKVKFELSGETGIDTLFPYQKQSCKLVQEGIEMITAGETILDRSDDQYYYVSILSGNLNFFRVIENLKLTDLTLVSTNHTWNTATMAASNAGALDYIYPLCEPSDDGGIAPMTDDGARVEMYGGWIWPFIKVKAIWDEIFLNAGFTCTGNILTDNKFLNLFIPVTSMKINVSYSDGYLYSAFRRGYMLITVNSIFGLGGTGMMSLIYGDYTFATGHYIAPFTANYKFEVKVTFLTPTPTIYLYVGGILTSTFNLTWSDATHAIYEWTYAATAADDLAVWGDANTYFNIEVAIIEITNPVIAFGSPLLPHNHLPDITQIDLIKIICNMFGLIPETVPRDRKVFFWNYLLLYENIPNARDWSAYLSEREDESEFKFGDYAQVNYLKYKESEDVIPDNGKGIMQVADETLPAEKDIMEVDISTCDEVTILTNVPSANVSRITFNKYDNKIVDVPAGTAYTQEDEIDPRIVFIKQLSAAKTFGIRPAVAAGGSIDTVSPKTATSIDVSFSNLVTNYAGLSRLLTKTNLRRAKFNLPVYEVAELKHYIPIYLRQYKAYFYVNKINNFVPGQLCTIDLIKL